MPRGLPDYGLLQAQTVSIEEGNINASALDVGFCRLDGGGRIVFFDDFRAGSNRWDLSSVAPGLVPYFRSDLLVGAGYYPSLYLDPVGANGYSVARVTGNMPVSGKIGVEFGYYLKSLHGIVYFQMDYQYALNVGYSARFRINYFTDSIGSWNGTQYVDLFPIGAAGLLLSKNLGLKFVVDGVNGLFDYLLVSDYKIPMGYPVVVSGATSLPGRYAFQVQHFGQSATYKAGMYLNYLVISADEP